MRLCLPKAGGERREPLTLPRPAQGAKKARSRGRILCLLTPRQPHKKMGPSMPSKAPLVILLKNQTKTKKKTNTCTAQMSLQHCVHLLAPLTLSRSHTEAATPTAQA